MAANSFSENATVGRRGGGKSCVSGSLWWWPDTESSLGRTQPRSCKLLRRLRLRLGQRSADADPRSLDAAGSDPPSRPTSIGTGEDGAGQPHPPRRCGVAPSKQSLAGRPNGEPVRPGSGVVGNAGQPTGQPVGQPVLRRLSEAHDTLPGRIDAAGATPGMRGEGVQARSPLCRTEPSARGVAPATADAARPATGGRAARPQDATVQADGRNVGCESPERRTVSRPPSSFSHSGSTTGGSARISANGRVLKSGLRPELAPFPATRGLPP